LREALLVELTPFGAVIVGVGMVLLLVAVGATPLPLGSPIFWPILLPVTMLTGLSVVVFMIGGVGWMMMDRLWIGISILITRFYFVLFSFGIGPEDRDLLPMVVAITMGLAGSALSAIGLIWLERHRVSVIGREGAS